MSDLNIHVRLSRRTCLWLLTLGLMAWTAAELGSESVNMTTYYPAPSGVYATMITTGKTILARDGSGVAVGQPGTGPFSKLDIISSGLCTYNETQANGLEIRSGQTKGTDYTLYMGADKINKVSYVQSVQWGTGVAPLILNGRGGNVGIGNSGIGISQPASKLSVAGGIQLGDDTLACVAAKDGTLRWHVTPPLGGVLQVCAHNVWKSVGTHQTDPVGGTFVNSFTYATPAGTTPVSLTVTCKTYGGSNAQGLVQVRWRKPGGLIKDWTTISGTNVGNGNDGGSGMSDLHLATIPFFGEATLLDFRPVGNMIGWQVNLLTYTHT